MEEIGTARPNAARVAAVSATSPAFVAVPCPLTYPTAEASSPASRSAPTSALAIVSAFGFVTCVPSVVSTKPTTSARMDAPRARACSYSSRMNVAAPSPITSPSRSASYGAGVACGASFRTDVA